MTDEPTVEERGAPRPRREYRATAAFLVTGLFVLLVVLLYGRTASGVPVIGALSLAGPVVSAVALLLIAVGLALGSTWAQAAMKPALWIVVIGGAISFLVGLTAGSIGIPIGIVLGIWALRARPQVSPNQIAGPSRGGVVAPILVAALLVTTAWPLIVPAATQPGGPLIAAASDLDLELTATPCPGEAGPPDTPPDFIDVVLRWTWARAEPMPAGQDAVVFSWATMGRSDPTNYFLDEPIPQQPGITEEDRFIMYAEYRVDLEERGFEPGAVTIRLHRPHELASGPGLVQVAATYAHHYQGRVDLTPLGLWTRAEVVNCDW